MNQNTKEASTENQIRAKMAGKSGERENGERGRNLSGEEKDLLARSKKKAKADAEKVVEGEIGDIEMNVEGVNKDPSRVKASCSYKERLLGLNGGETDVSNEELFSDDSEEEDLDDDSVLNDDDDPYNPRVKYTAAEMRSWCKPWRRALLVKLLGKRLSVSLMKSKIEKMWHPVGRMSIIDIENEEYCWKNG